MYSRGGEWAWQLLQIFNNNVVLANSRERGQAVLVGRGIGYAMSSRDFADPSKIKDVFAPSSSQPNEQLAASWKELPEELLALSRELADAASLFCGLNPTDSFVILLADHIKAAIARAIAGHHLPNPMQWEVKQLYPREYDFGQRALTMIKQATGVGLEDAEATSIALHAVNAHFTGGDSAKSDSFAETLRMTELMAKVLHIVEVALSDTNPDADSTGSLDTNSMATARFVVHLRFLLRRLMGERNSPHAPDPAMLAMADSMADQYP